MLRRFCTSQPNQPNSGLHEPRDSLYVSTFVAIRSFSVRLLLLTTDDAKLGVVNKRQKFRVSWFAWPGLHCSSVAQEKSRLDPISRTYNHERETNRKTGYEIVDNTTARLVARAPTRSRTFPILFFAHTYRIPFPVFTYHLCLCYMVFFSISPLLFFSLLFPLVRDRSGGRRSSSAFFGAYRRKGGPWADRFYSTITLNGLFACFSDVFTSFVSFWDRLAAVSFASSFNLVYLSCN